MKKIVIVVSEGRVNTVFASEKVEVEIIDFDVVTDEYEESDLKKYIDECKEIMEEIDC